MLAEVCLSGARHVKCSIRRMLEAVCFMNFKGSFELAGKGFVEDMAFEQSVKGSLFPDSTFLLSSSFMYRIAHPASLGISQR